MPSGTVTDLGPLQGGCAAGVKNENSKLKPSEETPGYTNNKNVQHVTPKPVNSKYSESNLPSKINLIKKSMNKENQKRNIKHQSMVVAKRVVIMLVKLLK